MSEIYQGLLLEAMEENDHGVTSVQEVFQGGKTTRVTLDKGNPFERPAGEYVTVELAPIGSLQGGSFEEAVTQISRVLRPMIRGEHILIAALGNQEITPDSLGPKMTAHLMITRPLEKLYAQVYRSGGFRSVAAVCTNVFGKTGIESAELIRGLCTSVRPDTVIVIDALATASTKRLCTTVQLSDGGISPGAGVDNHRPRLNRSTLGVPVISMGMPTVLDAALLPTALREDQAMIVTSAQIGVATDNGAKLLAYSINHALHGLSISEMLGFLS